MASAILINTCPCRLLGVPEQNKEGQLPLTGPNNHFCTNRVSLFSFIPPIQLPYE